MPRILTVNGVLSSAPSAIYFTAPNIPGRAPQRSSSPAPLVEVMMLMAAGWTQDFNDTHTHAEVLALLDKAILLREAEITNNMPTRSWRVVGQTWKLV